MDDESKKKTIERFILAYNAFDIDGMITLLHPECVFQNISGGEVNASTTGLVQFRQLAEQSKRLFSSRAQIITGMKYDGGTVTADIDYEGVLREDLPNGLKAGQTLKLKGQSVFVFKDGKIYKLTDYS